MKKTHLFFIFLFFSAFSAHAQITEMYVSHMSMKTYNQITGWNDWSEWRPVDMMIELDMNDVAVIVHSGEASKFDIAYFISMDEKEGVVKMACDDPDGERCFVTIEVVDEDEVWIFFEYQIVSVAYYIYEVVFLD